METHAFSQEVLYYLSASTSMDAAFDQFGIKKIEKGFFLLMLNVPEEI
tara:strand:- start:178 stop:321 length:144 start_codon:yes stop_codon:yes gene_type:complete